MYGIDRFSKKAFLEHCDNVRVQIAQRHKVTDDSLENVSSFEWNARLALGRYIIFGQLKGEVEQGGIMNNSGRFSEAALADRLREIYEALRLKHRFTDSGYNQVDGKRMEVVTDYLLWNAVRNILRSELY